LMGLSSFLARIKFLMIWGAQVRSSGWQTQNPI
jgi:hypothetical protein